MTFLDRIVGELHEADVPIRSTELAVRIGVSEQVLEGMISVLVQKGSLASGNDVPIENVIACSGAACGTSCVGLAECPFIADVPETYSLVIGSVDRG